MSWLPEEYERPTPITVWWNEDPIILGIIYGPTGEVVSIITEGKPAFGFARFMEENNGEAND